MSNNAKTQTEQQLKQDLDQLEGELGPDISRRLHQARCAALAAPSSRHSLNPFKYWKPVCATALASALQKRAKSLEEVNLGSRAAMNFKDEFLTNLSHEFRTSLNDVLGALTLLGNSNINESQKDLLTLAENASERQLDLVDNVMDYSRIAAKDLVLDVAVFNLPRYMEHLLEEISGEAYQHGIELHFLFSDELPSRVKGDSIRFGKVLAYLMSHAIQYSEHSALLVKADFKYEKDNTGELKVVISDNVLLSDREGGGGGELPDNSEQPIDPARAAKGGVALSICKGLAECMDGSICISTEPGRGVELRLSICFPIADQKPWSLNTSPKLKGKRVLLVSPPAVTEESLLAELGRWGMRAEEVLTTDKALIRLDESLDGDHPFDGLVLWSEANDSSVLSFSRQLSQDTQHSSLQQVLALSPLLRHSEEVREHLKSCPQIRIISKPLLHQRLHDAFISLWFAGDQSLKARSSHLEFDPQSRNRDRTILLVEDHRVNQMVAKSLLQKLGYNVEVADNGKEALVSLEGNNYDLILMDCQMPEMDGYSATRELRRREEDLDAHTPVIAMTAHTEEGIQSRCLAAGMDDYMAKPVRLDDLERRLRRWLG